MLIGEYQYTIDTKKRLALPAKFRRDLGDFIIITRGIDTCLAVYPKKEWAIESEKLSRLPESQSEARRYVRVKMSGAMQVYFDKLGRILIPDYLKKYAGLKKNVVVCGLTNKLEIWDEQKWETHIKKAEKEVPTLASKLSGSGV